MGDRCWLYLTFRKENEATIARRIDGPSWKEGDTWYDDLENDDGPCKEVHFYEANYALHEELQELAKKNIPFFVRHGGGGEFNPAIIISMDGQIRDQITDIQGHPVIHVDDFGNANIDELKASMAFANYHGTVEELVKMDISEMGFYHLDLTGHL